MDNPENLATQGTQGEDKQNKNTTQCVGHQYTQTNTNNVNKTCLLCFTNVRIQISIKLFLHSKCNINDYRVWAHETRLTRPRFY